MQECQAMAGRGDNNQADYTLKWYDLACIVRYWYLPTRYSPCSLARQTKGRAHGGERGPTAEPVGQDQMQFSGSSQSQSRDTTNAKKNFSGAKTCDCCLDLMTLPTVHVLISHFLTTTPTTFPSLFPCQTTAIPSCFSLVISKSWLSSCLGDPIPCGITPRKAVSPSLHSPPRQPRSAN